MSSVISASTTSTTALTLSGDTSGQLEIKTGSGPTTAVTITTGQQVQVNTGGSASTPVISKSDDTNTGIFFPAADTIAFTEGGVESMRIDSSGNVGIGVTPSAWSTGKALELGAVGAGIWGAFNDLYLTSGYYYNSAHKFAVTGNYAMFFQPVSSDGSFRWYSSTATGTAGDTATMSERMRITSGGEVLIGTTTSNSFKFKVSDGGGAEFAFAPNDSGVNSLVNYNRSTSAYFPFQINSLDTRFLTSGTERMRITSGGALLVGASSQPSFFSAAAKMYVEMSGADYTTAFRSTNASPSGIAISYSTTPNGASNYFIDARDNTAQRFAVKSNGGIDNYSGNNTNLSDRREKTNIELAGSYLNKICSIPIKTFNYIDQNLEEDGGLTLGVIAQDVEAVAPELIMESDWSVEKDGSKMRLSIYQTDLQYALMKCIQELKAELDEAKAEIQALKGAN